MTLHNNPQEVHSELIPAAIFYIRGQKVMLSTDLAKLYGVEVRTLIQAVKRNIQRFPIDFMFELTKQEADTLIIRSQIVILRRHGTHSKYLPYAFTEQGVAMLSSVLHSKRAIQVNIEIMRMFVKLRKLLSTNSQMAEKIEVLEKKYDSQFKIVFDALKVLMISEDSSEKDPIGFTVK